MKNYCKIKAAHFTTVVKFQTFFLGLFIIMKQIKAQFLAKLSLTYFFA